jgi:DNA-binding NtrC family response regulator
MPENILVIDDELHMLKLLERIIVEKTDYRVETLNNSLELPACLKDKEFDLIITDLKMPGMDGLDVLRFIKDNNRFEEVVIITAFGSLESATEALSGGVFDYITKPFRKEEIIYTIRRAMNWQECKRETRKLQSFFESEPYAGALENFRAEYIKRMLEKCSGSVEEAARRSGIASADIEAMSNKARGGAEKR